MHKRAANPRLRQMRSRLCALLIAGLLVIEPAMPVHAQATGALPQRLQIMILEGEGALNNIRERTAREPIVQVQDENHKPVSGALVLFSAHGGSSGASGTFANDLNTLSVTTDADGKAVAHGLKPNQNAGTWELAVTATVGALTATVIIHQKNYLPAPANPPTHWFTHKPVIIAGAAIIAGTIIGIVAAKSNHGTTINVGPGSVGPPTAGVAPAARFTFGKKGFGTPRLPVTQFISRRTATRGSP